MKRKFTLKGFEIATITDLRNRITFVTIVKNDQVLMNEAFAGTPFPIDFAKLIEKF